MAGQHTLIINNHNVTDWIPPAGYTVSTKVVSGQNNMTMADGTIYKDEIATKDTVKVPFLPLYEYQLAQLYSYLYNDVTCVVTYQNPNTGATRTMTAYRSISERKFRGAGADGLYYWTGVEVTFEER